MWRLRVALLPAGLWNIIAPLFAPDPPKPQGGRRRVPDPVGLAGILFVLTTGCTWQALPRELGCGSGRACWRRLHTCQRAGASPLLLTVGTPACPPKPSGRAPGRPPGRRADRQGD